MNLPHALERQFQQQKECTFAEFMHIALYDPKAGYYSSTLPKLGAQGDFITAPELTPLFGYSVANQCQQVLSRIPSPKILEFGAGSGALCISILQQLERLNCLPEYYWIMEVSSDFQERQRQKINQALPHLAHRIQWLEQWPETSFNGIILANEVLDAMPVHRFLVEDEVLLESYVALNQHGELIEHFKPCQNRRLMAHLSTILPNLTPPYLSEVNLFINDWIAHQHQLLDQGLVLLIDYGFPRHEYYHPDRNQGTLMCHYQHHAHANPLIHVGEQDITAHVDFTHVAEAGHQAGFHVAGYTNQASFLLANGLLHLIDEQAEALELFKTKQAIKQLTQSNEMGELFKVIALTKNWDSPLNGFLLNDKRVSL
jgi:SAM-dependent MidA family methyltransferase